ncbi:phage replisome organizer N-terminal domain-containing protein [Streptococcus suis]|uniref:phage replisome organizer N-terminal domain-containing protein n=1 Tax=Streptococcus suis TaxID=1307 RepID=UPI000423C1E1|nr:phage replisome organizer N-terminal domain-containing protein [Streptococcus suis]HEM3213536.1 phage replisome organizer N-terminal domain-containing protein [Streptococcus suis 12814]HEM4253995.1 phage replisome organizer N-terminal domain-containing protein [Streptococcus suis]
MASEIKWIKITTDIFDDDKIMLLESMPEGDTLLVIWLKVLVLAGRQNQQGFLMMNDKIAYTDEMLATIFRRDLKIVRMALSAFEQFGMIEIDDSRIFISNWEKHQNVDGMEKAREKNRKRQTRFREKQKQLKLENDSNVTRNVTVTQSNALDLELDKELDKELEVLDSLVLERAEKSKDFPAPAGAEPPQAENQSGNYIQPEYYSLLGLIADRYNSRCFGYPGDCYQLTHQQKILIGQRLAEGYVTSDEVLGVIDRMPDDLEKPLAYLLSCLDNIKQERLLEAKAKAHAEAQAYYSGADEAKTGI